jgi:hypothetical protein
MGIISPLFLLTKTPSDDYLYVNLCENKTKLENSNLDSLAFYLCSLNDVFEDTIVIVPLSDFITSYYSKVLNDDASNLININNFTFYFLIC